MLDLLLTLRAKLAEIRGMTLTASPLAKQADLAGLMCDRAIGLERVRVEKSDGTTAADARIMAEHRRRMAGVGAVVDSAGFPPQSVDQGEEGP